MSDLLEEVNLHHTGNINNGKHQVYTVGKLLEEKKHEHHFNDLIKNCMIDPLKEMKIGEEEDLSHFNRSFDKKITKSFCQISPDDYAD